MPFASASPAAVGRALRRIPRGVAAVELAILSLPIAALMLGAFEFGRAIYTYNTLNKSIRDAARHLSQAAPGDPGQATASRCIAMTGQTACTSVTPLLAPGLTDSHVKFCDAVNTTDCVGSPAMQVGNVGTMHVVTASIVGYQYSSIASFVLPSSLLTFNNISVTMRAQL